LPSADFSGNMLVDDLVLFYLIIEERPPHPGTAIKASYDETGTAVPWINSVNNMGICTGYLFER
jgi:hypothetical protein